MYNMHLDQNIKLFCVPSAGSSASIYHAWDKTIGNEIQVIPLEYPGHGRKTKQPLTHDPDDIATQLIADILTSTDQPFALFGHSVGASLLWKIEQHLIQQHLQHLLKCMIVSARPSPIFQHQIHRSGRMTDAEIIQELKCYNNFPNEILNNSDALKFFLNIIRNDFLLSDQLLSQDIKKTTTPLMAIYGKADPFIQNQQMMNSWQHYSSSWLGVHALEGDHFYFLNEHILEHTLSIIQLALKQIWYKSTNTLATTQP